MKLIKVKDFSLKAELSEFKDRIVRALDFADRMHVLLQNTNSEKDNFPAIDLYCRTANEKVGDAKKRLIQALNEAKDSEKDL